MSETPATPRLRRIQRTALALLLLGGVINYIDRSTLAIGLPLIQHDLGFSLRQSGYLLSAFLWAYAICQLPSGIIIDRLGARLMLSLGLGLWSGAQIAASAVVNLWQFVVVRVLLGAGESPMFSTSARTVTDWFTRRERGLATGIWNCSSTLGIAISAPLLTFLMMHFGWRWMFGIMGLAGLLVSVAAYAIHRDPDQVSLTDEEKAHLHEKGADAPPITLADWRGLFRYATTWGMIAGFFGNVYLGWIYNAWLPRYLELEWHFSIAHTGWIAALPFSFGVVGSILGGRVCDIFHRHGFSAVTSRKIPVIVSLLGSAACTLGAAATHDSVMAICCICGTLFLLYIGSAAAWAMATVATVPTRTASLGAIQNFGGYLGGALAPTVTGLIAEQTQSFRPALVVGACVAIAGAILHFILVRGPVAMEETA